jgi:hypothetical protein
MRCDASAWPEQKDWYELNRDAYINISAILM